VPGSPPAEPPAALAPTAAPSRGRWGHRRLWAGAAVALALLLVIGGVFGIHSLFHHTAAALPTLGPTPDPSDPEVARPVPPVSDLAFVPSKTRALMSVRVSDMWNAPPVQQAWEKIPEEMRTQATEASREVGLDAANLERITLVMHNELKKEVWFVVRTTRPFSRAQRERLLSRLKDVRLEDRTYNGVVYQFATLPAGPDGPAEPLGIYAASEHVVVIGTEPGLFRALDYFKTGGDKDGELARARSLIEQGKDHFLMAGALQEEDQAAFPERPPLLRFLGPDPKDVKSGVFQIHFGKVVDLKVTTTCTDAAKAEALRQQIDLSMKLRRPFVQFGGRGGANAAFEDLAKQLLAMKTEVSGPDLVIRGQIDLDRLAPHFQDAFRPFGETVANEATTGVQNLKDLARAFEKYHEANGHYPPAVVCDKDGKPLYSWRVALLPYLDENPLYAQFDRELPWDHPTNFRLLARMPRVFAHPAIPADKTREQTCFQLLTGPKAAFHEGRLVKKADLKDGPGSTIFLVEHQQCFPWTAPMDVLVPDDPNRVKQEVLPRLGLLQGIGTFQAALFDGSVHKLKRSDAEGFLHAVYPADGVGLPDS
jgi:hypothetical protein